jgi:hypoxanthine phosphoribosyltransferase
MNDYDISDFKSGKFKILYSEAEILNRVHELAQAISNDYQDKMPVLIGVLNGAFMFLADLAKRLEINCEIDFIKISSYGNEKSSSGQIKLKKDIDCHLEGREVIVVEDIVDSGLSIKFLESKILALKPKSLKFVSLFLKQGTAKVEYHIDYVGFKIPDEFVVGYGLDFAQKFRNLPALYILK